MAQAPRRMHGAGGGGAPEAPRSRISGRRRHDLAEPFGPGAVMGSTLGTWFAQLPFFLGVTAVLLAPYWAAGWWHTEVALPADLEDARGGGMDGVGAILRRIALRMVGVQLLQSVGLAIAAGVFAYAVVRRLQRQPAGLGESLQVGFARLPTVLGVSIVVGLLTGLAVGLPLLLAPGSRGLLIVGQIAALLVTLVLCVAVPVGVVERLGVAGALARSAALTRGSRVTIFLAYLVIGLALGLLLTPLLLALAFADSGSPLQRMRAEFWSNGIVATLTGSVSAVAQSVIYHGVRRRREGVSAEELVKAFE